MYGGLFLCWAAAYFHQMKSESFLPLLLFPEKKLQASRLKAALHGKTLLITGASYGIGETLALACAFEQTQLILVARTKEKLLLVKEEIEQKGGNAAIFAVDLRDEKQLGSLIDFLKKEENAVDVFVNNAGKSIRRSVWNSLDRFHDVERTNALNYLTPVRLCLSLIPVLAKKKGQIINVSALNVLLPPAPRWAAYQASKSAFDQWFRSVAPELKSQGIDCSTAYLPLVRTRMIAPTKQYEKAPAMLPEQAARVLARLIISRKKCFRPWWMAVVEPLAFLLKRPLERWFEWRV
ncbi:MAG: SDR family NAD(P)-dependent oxidoreductase [Thiotrichaceae bacterium]